MEDVDIFYGHIVYLVYILYGHLVYFVKIWYIFPRFALLYKEKSGNPADTLALSRRSKFGRGSWTS
jgi:hypothetical protein